MTYENIIVGIFVSLILICIGCTGYAFIKWLMRIKPGMPPPCRSCERSAFTVGRDCK